MHLLGKITHACLSQSACLVCPNNKGKKTKKIKEVLCMFHLVKVRVDLSKMPEFGKKIANRELDNSKMHATYCIKDDPAVGYTIWETKDEKEFKDKFAPYKKFYKEVEVIPVVTANEAQQLLMETSKN